MAANSRWGTSTFAPSNRFGVGQDARLTPRLGGQAANVGLFADPNAEGTVPLKGRYELVAEALVFERMPRLT